MLSLKASMSLASRAIRVAPVRALGVSAVRQDTISMKEPLSPVPTAAEDSVYQNFIVPDNSKYRELQKRQLFFTEHILEDMWTLTDKPNKSAFLYTRYFLVAFAIFTYFFTTYRINLGKKKREGQVI